MCSSGLDSSNAPEVRIDVEVGSCRAMDTSDEHQNDGRKPRQSALEMNEQSSRVADYLDEISTGPKLVMLAYLAWYIVVVIATWSGNPKPFMDAMVIMFLIGLVLNANAYASFRQAVMKSAKDESKEPPSVYDYVRAQSCSVARLFLIPYCVASYSALVNSDTIATTEFVLIFPTSPMVWGPALAAATGAPAVVRLSAIAARRFGI